MELLSEIRSKFAETSSGTAQKLVSTSELFPAWVLRIDGWYGVGIPYDSENKVTEHFADAKLWSATVSFGGEPKCLLILGSQNESYRQEFASICSQFVEPGLNGCQRADLIKDPLKWWNNWKNLIGNAVIEKHPYSVLAELLFLFHLLRSGEKDIRWGASNKSSYDISGVKTAWEIKSTTNRYDNIINISSHFQLEASENINLFLIFFRFEESMSGISLNDIINKLIYIGYNYNDLENHMTNLGFENGSHERKIKYIMHEVRQYFVDDEFPKITASMFIGSKIHPAIKKISYQIDLTNIEYDSIVIPD